MKIRLKVAVKTRDGRIIVPGVYDQDDENFPECLIDEDRESIVEIIPDLPSTPVEEGEDQENEDNEEETVEEGVGEGETFKKKKKKKRG